MLITFDTVSNGFILSRGKDNLSGTELSTSLGKLIAQYRDVLLVAHKIPWCIVDVGMTISSRVGNVSFECGKSGVDSFCKISLVDITYLDVLFSGNNVDYESISNIVSGILEELFFSYMTSVFWGSFDFSDIELYSRFSTRGSMLKPMLHQESIQFISNKISYSRVGERLELRNFDFSICSIYDTLRGSFSVIDVFKLLETIQYIRERFLISGFSFDVIVRGVGSVYPVDYFECGRDELVSLRYDRREYNRMTTILADGSTVGAYRMSVNDDYITFAFLISAMSSTYKLMGTSFFDVNKFFSILERSVFEFGEFVGCHR
nr:MAG TPA: hypothetical protein [Herelleviridae sp.]